MKGLLENPTLEVPTTFSIVHSHAMLALKPGQREKIAKFISFTSSKWGPCGLERPWNARLGADR
jgi:hypothetical protein